MLTSSFKNDLLHIYEKLKRGENFSFSKYADGEYAILRNVEITNIDNWTFDSLSNKRFQELLMDSFLPRIGQSICKLCWNFLCWCKNNFCFLYCDLSSKKIFIKKCRILHDLQGSP